MRLAIRLARQSLRTHKLRARLSTIGIVISITLVSLIFIISDSVKASLTKQVNQLNNHSIIINGTTNNSLFNLISSLPDDIEKKVEAQRPETGRWRFYDEQSKRNRLKK